MSVGTSKNDVIAAAGTGLASTPAVSVGDAANEDLTSVFRYDNTNGENVFNVSVNGISGVIEIPTGFYVGSTLAEALESRINQIQDPVTGDTVGGVTVKYDSTANNFTFTTGTTGNTSTIKVKGRRVLALMMLRWVLEPFLKFTILFKQLMLMGWRFMLMQQVNVVTTPPDNLVEGYYPLYIDEGELTFDNGGRIISPKNLVHYERRKRASQSRWILTLVSQLSLPSPFRC